MAPHTERSEDREVSRRRLLQLTGITALSTTALPIVSGLVRAASLPEEQLRLCYMPATEQLEKFKTKELSPVEVIKAQLARSEAVEGKVNNFIQLYPEEAIEAAKASEARYMTGESLPLDGITCAVKDELAIKGKPLTAGSRILADNISEKNDPLVDRLLDDGAILHGITTVPEMYFAGVTWTDLWGVTRNPWNTEYTVGGSSGGSGGALAAGQSTIATGSDMGGSIRIPAAFCGCYGFKPPYGRIPASLGATFLFPSTSGPMARNLKDLILMQNNMAGPTPQSLTALRPKLVLPLEYPHIKGMKIAYSVDQGWAEVEPETRAAFMTAIEVLSSQGAIVEEVDLGLGMTGNMMRLTLTQALLSGSFGGQLKELVAYADSMTSYGRYFAEIAATGMGPDEALEAANTQEELNLRIQEAVFNNGYTALLEPTLNTSRLPADYDPTADTLMINGKVVDPHVGAFQTPLWNLLNWHPVLNVPIGLTSYNMPVGMQIIANTFEDAVCMQVAAAYEPHGPRFFAGGKIPEV